MRMSLPVSLPWRAHLRSATILVWGILTTQAIVSAPTSNITGIWANEGGDKVTQDELRTSRHKENLTGTVLNSTWDGTTIQLFGAANESVSFNLILEAAGAAASHVSLSFDTLTGPNGAKIQTTRQATGNDVFQWVNRPIELFYTRYLQIKGLSFFGWFMGNEAGFPARFRAPNDHAWSSRPDHDKFYPDILVPLELTPDFTIASGQNQAIWADIYIPKGSPAGTYTGQVTIKENGVVTHTVPVSLAVQSFSLPDKPSMEQFVNVDPTELEWRYFTGWGGYVGWNTPQGWQIKAIADKYYQFFHRHRIDVIAGETECPPQGTQICWMNWPRYTGDLYTAANGYDGPGVGVGTGIYSIGTYGGWGRNIFDPATMQQLADGWESWFQQNLPNTKHFWYLEDEPPMSDLPLVENWAKWIAESNGPGKNLWTLATLSVSGALQYVPDLKIPMTAAWIGDCGTQQYCANNTAVTQNEVNQFLQLPDRHLMEYNLNRPGVGTSNTEDDGTAMRTIAWVQYKMGIEGWFYWYANLNTQNVDWFQYACTWNCAGSYQDRSFGWTSGTSTNGNGLLVYPGTDVTNTQNSYGVQGPFASVRLKEWRRGIEDGDYLTLAAKYDPVATKALVQLVMPKALWENPAPNGDPSWYMGPVSWSSNPDDWEAARRQLAQIITSHCATAQAVSESASPCTSPGTTTTTLTTPTTTPTTPTTTTNPTTPVTTPVTPTVTPAVNTVPALQYVPITPCRLIDTRSTTGIWGGPLLAAGATRNFPIRNSPCPVPATAQAVAVNITVVPHGPLRWLTVWPGAQTQPNVSTLNSFDARTKANFGIFPLDSDGGLSFYATDNTDLVVDVSGYFVSGSPAGSLVYYPVTPCRLVDTRNDWGALGKPFLAAQQERHFPVLTSPCAVPTTAQAYALNFTAIPKKQLAWLTAWPAGQTQPPISTLNAPTGVVTANAAITLAGSNGDISLYASDATDLVIDITGYFAPPGTGGLSLYTLSPCRSYDTRTQGNQGAFQGVQTFTLSQSSCSIPATAPVLLLNVTAVPMGPLSYISLWSAGDLQPTVSTLNANDGQVTSNLAFVPSVQGAINAYTSGNAFLIFDTFGYFAP